MKFVQKFRIHIIVVGIILAIASQWGIFLLIPAVTCAALSVMWNEY